MTTLTRLRELLAAATEAPGTELPWCEAPSYGMILDKSNDAICWAQGDDVCWSEKADDLAAAAVNALPALLRVAEAAKRCQPTKIGHMGHCQANARLDCTCGKYENDAEHRRARNGGRAV